MAKDETQVVEKLVDVKLQSLRKTEIVSKEIHIVSEVVQSRYQLLIRIGQALRRRSPNQVVVPQRIRERSSSSHVKFRGVPAHRRRTDLLAHPERDSLAGGRRQVAEIGRSLSVSAPAATLLHMGERISSAWRSWTGGRWA